MRGKKVNFKNTIIIMTSNIGADILLKSGNEIGFRNKENKIYNKNNEKDMADNNENKNNVNDSIKIDVLKEVNKILKKEFLNRIDEIIVFNRLSKDFIKKIIEKYIFDLATRFEKASYKINICESVTEFVLNNCLENQNGARDIKRNIKNLIEDKITEEIITNNLEKGSCLNIYVDNENNLIIDKSN